LVELEGLGELEGLRELKEAVRTGVVVGDKGVVGGGSGQEGVEG